MSDTKNVNKPRASDQQNAQSEDFKKTLTEEQSKLLAIRNEANKDRPIFRSALRINSSSQKDLKE